MMVELHNIIQLFTDKYDKISQDGMVLWFNGENPKIMYKCQNTLKCLGFKVVELEYDKANDRTPLVLIIKR